MTTPIHGITRFEYQKGMGYLARYYAHDRVKQKLFSDSRYGYDPQRALNAAQRWLHTCAHDYEPRPHFRQRSLRTQTGRVGVCLRQKRERNGATFSVYDVNYTVQGRRRTHSFRVHLFPSQKTAFQAACIYREARERDMQRERRQTLRRQWQEVP